MAAERDLRAAQAMTPVLQQLAPHLDEVPQDEFIARLTEALMRRPR